MLLVVASAVFLLGSVVNRTRISFALRIIGGDGSAFSSRTSRCCSLAFLLIVYVLPHGMVGRLEELRAKFRSGSCAPVSALTYIDQKRLELACVLTGEPEVLLRAISGIREGRVSGEVLLGLSPLLFKAAVPKPWHRRASF